MFFFLQKHKEDKRNQKEPNIEKVVEEFEKPILGGGFKMFTKENPFGNVAVVAPLSPPKQ